MANSSIPLSHNPRLLALATWLMVATTPLLAYRWPIGFGNASLSRVAMVILALALVFTPSRVSSSHLVARRILFTLPLVAVWIASLLYSPQVEIGLRLLIKFLEGFAVMALLIAAGLHLAKTLPQTLVAIPGTAFIPTGMIALFQSWQTIRGQIPTIPFLQYASLDEMTQNAARVTFSGNYQSQGVERVAAATGDPPTFGIICALVVVYTLWLRLNKEAPKPSSIANLGAVIAIAGLIMSASISAVLVLVTGLMALAWGQRARSGTPSGSILAKALGGIALLVIPLYLAVQFLPRFQGYWATLALRISNFLSGQESASGHRQLLSGAWDIWSSHPLFGVGAGAGSFEYVGQPVGFSSFHSISAITIAELGLAGFVAMLLALLGLLGRNVPMGIVVSVLVAWNVYLDWNRTPFVWAILGIVVAVQYMISARREQRDWSAGGVGDTDTQNVLFANSSQSSPEVAN